MRSPCSICYCNFALWLAQWCGNVLRNVFSFIIAVTVTEPSAWLRPVDVRGEMGDSAGEVDTRPGSTRLCDSDTMLNGNWSPCRDKVLTDLWRIRDKGTGRWDRDKKWEQGKSERWSRGKGKESWLRGKDEAVNWRRPRWESWPRYTSAYIQLCARFKAELESETLVPLS